jgi:hypothetical protein
MNPDYALYVIMAAAAILLWIGETYCHNYTRKEYQRALDGKDLFTFLRHVPVFTIDEVIEKVKAALYERESACDPPIALAAVTPDWRFREACLRDILEEELAEVLAEDSYMTVAYEERKIKGKVRQVLVYRIK